MSVWKSNFFLQNGLPDALPKPPERDHAADEQFAAEHELPRKRRQGERGKDRVVRNKRPPSLYNFYESMRAIELREADGNVPMHPHQTQSEYNAFSQHQRAYWEHMQALFFVFERTQLIGDPSLYKLSVTTRKNKLWNKFYYLKGPEQQQLERDYHADRWQRENYDYVRQTCHQDNLRDLVGIRTDLRALLTKVERALRGPVTDIVEPDQPA